MCGVAGILKLGERRIDPDWIEAMCRVQAHRGPDDAGYAFFRHGEGQRREGGYWVEFTDAEFAHLNEHLPAIQGDYARHELPRYDFDLALGHRRLSILDLTHYGHQPMANSDRRLWVVLNGEIYNFPQLRSDLEAKGHVFRTRSDTEVLLHLWEDQGPDCLAALDGMFGIAVYDRTAGRLYLARDRFGVKPMYWARTDDFLVFASEPKGILASGRIEPRIDPGSLAEYMTFQNLYGERILFEGIHLLPPGEVLEVDVGTVSPTLRRHRYQPGFPSGGAAPTDMDTAAAEVADAFESAVRRQLISDVPVGSYLSGGMDSGSIVAVAGREFPRLLTFTGGFDLTNVSGIEQGFDERPMAERLSHLLQTEHYDVVLHAGDMPAAMERLAWHMDDPRLGMCHQNWYVAKLASKFVKVCLAGAGGDELFGGYPWRYRQGLRAADEAAFDEACFEHWHRLLPGDELPGIFTGELQPHLARPRETFDALMAGLP
ncbi:MAG: asparagine synthase (glutamine-hydrolyzing), partial [Myxococcales bacterium]|nr:asparagine synthase (glutamine-hydrolyzing) [Myxococcales bacterium]